MIILNELEINLIFIKRFSSHPKRFPVKGGPHQPPPVCSPHLGDARQPIGGRTLTTHQLEAESEGVNESANHTGGLIRGQSE